MRDEPARVGRCRRRRGALHGRAVSERGRRQFAWCRKSTAFTVDAPAALRALFVHERALAASDDLPADGRAQQLVFLAAYHLIASAAGTLAAWQTYPSARIVQHGSRAIGLGTEEAEVALGFVRLLTVPGWQRFSLQTMLDWDAQVRVAFLKACTRAT